MSSIIPGSGVVLRGSRPGGDGRIGAEVVAAFRRPARHLLGGHDILDPCRLLVFLNVAQRVTFALHDRIGFAGDAVAQIIKLRILDRVGERRFCAGGRRRGNLWFRLGRGNFGFRNGLDCGCLGRFIWPQKFIDASLDTGLLIKEPYPDE